MPDLEEIFNETVQSQVRQEQYSGLDVLPLFIKAGELIPPWWSKARDFELSRFWPRVDHVSSAINMLAMKISSIPVKIVPKDTSIKAHTEQADYFNSVLVDGADYGSGWHASLCPRLITSYSTQDNGMFCEVIGEAPVLRTFQIEVNGKKVNYDIRDVTQPIIGPVLGFAFLDPQRIQRTSSPEYPAIYWDISGERYKFHHTRIMMASSMPTHLVKMNKVGYCALTRMINTAQHILDISVIEQEELGSRPKRRIIIGKKGVTAADIRNAFAMADQSMDNEGLSRYSKSVVIAPSDKRTVNTEIDIDIKDIHAALAGEDKELSVTLGMFLIALALGIPPRWLWPASQAGATKADAMYQHIAGAGGGVGHLLMVFKQMLGGDSLATAFGKPIPSHLDIVFDFQDDEQDRASAEVRDLRSKVYSTNLTSGVYDLRTARLQARDAGDITDDQFISMELTDGRLEDGQDVINLFYTADPELQKMLTLSIGDVLNTEMNTKEEVLPRIKDKELEARAMLANPTRPKEASKAQMALAALEALRKLYDKPDSPTDKPPDKPTTPPVAMPGQEVVKPVDTSQPGPGQIGQQKQPLKPGKKLNEVLPAADTQPIEDNYVE